MDGEPQELELLLNSSPLAATSAGETKYFDSGKVRVLDCIAAVTCAVVLATTTCASTRAARSYCRAASIASLRVPERNLLRQNVLDIGNKNCPGFTAPFHVRWIILDLLVDDRSLVVD